MADRTFRRHIAQFWNRTPLPPVSSTFHRVLFFDGVQISKKHKQLLLIARSEHVVVSWEFAKKESQASWERLLDRCAEPGMVHTFWPIARVWTVNFILFLEFYVFMNAYSCSVYYLFLISSTFILLVQCVCSYYFSARYERSKLRFAVTSSVSAA